MVMPARGIVASAGVPESGTSQVSRVKSWAVALAKDEREIQGYS